MRRDRHAFTLIEISISVFIMLLLLVMAVPSLQGVMADRRLRRSFDDLNKFVRLAQERSVADRRPYLIAWQKDHIILRPEAYAKGEDPKVPTATFLLQKGDAFVLELPAALVESWNPFWTRFP